MKLKLTKEEQRFLLQFQAFSGMSDKDAEEFFKSLMKIIYVECVEEGKCVIPYVGELSISYDPGNDRVIDGKSIPLVESTIKLSNYIKDSIVSYSDGEPSVIVKKMQASIRRSLEKQLSS